MDVSMRDGTDEGWSLSTIFKWSAGAGILAGGASLVTGTGLSTAASVGMMSTMITAPALSWLNIGVQAVRKLLGNKNAPIQEPVAESDLPEAPQNSEDVENSLINEPEQPQDQNPDQLRAAIWRLAVEWGQEDSTIPAIEVGLLKNRLAENKLDSGSDEVWQEIARAAAPDWKKAVAEGRHKEVWPEVLDADMRAAHIKMARSFARSAAEYQPPGPERQGFERIEFDSGAYYSGLAHFQLAKSGLNPDSAVARFIAGLPQLA